MPPLSLTVKSFTATVKPGSLVGPGDAGSTALNHSR